MILPINIDQTLELESITYHPSGIAIDFLLIWQLPLEFMMKTAKGKKYHSLILRDYNDGFYIITFFHFISSIGKSKSYSRALEISLPP